MILSDHRAIESIDSIALNDKRLILHNGSIVIATIKNILTKDIVDVEVNRTIFRINTKSIYRELPK